MLNQIKHSADAIGTSPAGEIDGHTGLLFSDQLARIEHRECAKNVDLPDHHV